MIKNGNVEAALPILEDIAQKEPDNQEVLPWLALSYISNSRLAEGRTALDTAIKLKLPCAAVKPAMEKYTKYYQTQNDFAEADGLLNSVNSLCPQIALGRARQENYIAWSDYDYANHNLAEAARHLQLAMNLSKIPSEQSSLSRKLADYYRQMAAAAESNGENDDLALELLHKSQAANNEPLTCMALGNIYARHEKFPEAIEQFLNVTRMDPNNLEAQHHLVDLYLRLNDLKGAQTVLSELADKERCIENYGLLAAIDLKLKNFAGAVRALEDATNLNPKDPELLKKLRYALLEWSVSLAKQGKQEESLSAKGRAERISEILNTLDKDVLSSAELDKIGAATSNQTVAPPFSLYASRTWLAKGSLTPEGEIRLKNTGKEPLTDLSLTIIFYDYTIHKRTGAVVIAAASNQHPLLPKQIRSLYFSSPNIIRSESQLCVIILWKGRFLTQLPVVKER